MSQNHLEITKNMSFNSILCCHQTLILLSVLLLFTSSHNNYLCSANDQLNNNSTDGFFTISSFTYPQATLKPFDFHYIRVDIPPWFSAVSIALNSDVDLDVAKIEKVPKRSLPIICFRDGSLPLPDALNTSLKYSAISGINGLDMEQCFPMEKNITMKLTNELISPGAWYIGLFNGIGDARTQSRMFQDEDTIKNGDSFGALDESVVASMMETEDVVDNNNNNKPAIENFDMMELDDNNQEHGGGNKKVVGLKRSSNGGGNVGPGQRRGRGRPKKSAAGSSSSNNNEFYYYSGFGPLWGKKRGEEDDSSNKSVVTLGGANSDDKVNVGNNHNNNYDNDNVGIEFGCGVDVNVVPCISDEEDYYDDYCDNDNGKRRMRKPVKERSLKSLM